MAEPSSGGGSAAGRRLLSPRVVFPLLAVVLVLTVLFTPETTATGDIRLTTESATPYGARGLYELLGRLGWRTARRAEGFRAGLDTAAVYVVLDPPNDLTAAETHALLEAVRGGAGLLMVAGRGSPLSDSLPLRRATHSARSYPTRAETSGCLAADNAPRGINWPDGRVMSWYLEATAPLPADTVTFIPVRRVVRDSAGGRPAGGSDDDDDALAESAADTLPSAGRSGRGARGRRVEVRAAAAGLPYGRGRIVAVADPDWLRNDVLRVCKWNAAVAAVRMAEYLSPDRARPFVFDEFHQGVGRGSELPRAVGRSVAGTAPGRALLQAIVASLILLAAAGARPIAPHPRARAERRSPLEHVGALARAYEQIGATRIATRRLVRGLRRRHRHLLGRGRDSDAELLRMLATRHPAIAAEVAHVARALDQPVSREEFVQVGRAVAEIERAIAG